MNVDAINYRFIEQFLRAYERWDETVLDEARSLDCLGNRKDEAVTAFHEFLKDRTTHELLRLRAYEYTPLPDDPEAEAQTLLRADMQSANTHLRAWSAIYHRYFDEQMGRHVKDMAVIAGISEDRFRDRVIEGAKKLAHLVRHEEMQAHNHQRAAYLIARLPPPEYLQLHDSQKQAESIAQLIQQRTGPYLISVEGIGGIGKTACVRAAIEQLIRQSALPDLADVIWITARQQRLDDGGQPVSEPNPPHTARDVIRKLAFRLLGDAPDTLDHSHLPARLTGIVKESFYLIVIDSLDCVTDAADLLPLFRQIADPSYVIVTTRHACLVAYSLPIKEISQPDSYQLIHTALGKRPDVPRQALDGIFAAVGGVPLALKLIGGYLRWHSPDDILRALKHPRHTCENKGFDLLLHHIYCQTWQQLDEHAQMLLALMGQQPDSTTGISKAHLADAAGLSPPDFEAAFSALQAHSLIDMRNTDRYVVHPLTVIFLQTGIYRLF